MANKAPKKHRESKVKPASKGISDTYFTTLQLFNTNKSPEEIARIRNLSVQTIQAHLAHLVANGKIEASELLDMNKVNPIVEIAKTQRIQSLKEIKETLGEEYSYFDIHLALAYSKWTEME